MRKPLDLARLALLTCLSSAAASAQSSLPIRTISTPVKNAGTYHLATGSWSRASSWSASGADVVYNNTGPATYFTPLADNAVQPYAITDTGRIPSWNDVGSAVSYGIHGLVFRYCSSSGVGQGLSSEWSFDQSGVAPCSGPGLGVSGSFVITGLPSSSAVGVQGCWTITIDLAGSSIDIVLQGDQDMIYDGLPALDDFAYTFAMSGHNDGTTGPILAGDPLAYPFGDGTTQFGFGPGPEGTGLDQQDAFWIETQLPPGSGCYNFGGHPAFPWGGFYLRLVTDQIHQPSAGGPYCDPGAANSVSSTGGMLSCVTDWHTNYPLISIHDVPDQPGILFYGDTALDQPFGCGRRCVGGQVTRGAVVVPSGNEIRTSIEVTGLFAIHLQYWYRDPANFAACGATFNLTNALQ